MNIAMIIEGWKPIWGGGQKVALELSKQFSRKHKVDLFVMNLDGNKDEQVAEKINNNLTIIKAGKKRKFTLKDRIKWAFEVVDIIVEKNHKDRRYDLIYAHATLPGISAKMIKNRLGIPCVYQVHGTGIDSMKDMYGPLKAKFFIEIETYIQRKIKYDLEISVDNRFLQYKNVNKAVFIPNGVDVKEFDKATKKVHGAGDKKRILFVGRLHPQKGLVYLVEAAGLMKDSQKDVLFIIVGDGDDKEMLIEKVNKSGLNKLFVFKGKLTGKELINEFKSADIFVLPSLYEGFPLTILEAWAAKLPVIATKVGENPNIIKEDFNGWLVDKQNPKQLAEKIKYALGKDLKKIGMNGYDLVCKEYSWEKVSENIMQKIETLKKNEIKK